MTTLPERLRIKASMISLGEKIAWGSDSEIMNEAADEIERLTTLAQGYLAELVSTRTQRNAYQQVADTMARHCRELTSLSLTWSASVTDAALIALIAPLPVVPLKCVRLNGCAQVTSSSVQLLVDALPNLASLEVSYCPKISIAAMAEVAARCPNIQFGRTGSY